MKQEKETAFNFSKALLHFDLEFQLPQIKCRTMVVIGSLDKAAKPAAHRTAQMIKNSFLYEIEGGGHQLNKTHEKEFASIVAEFVKTLH